MMNKTFIIIILVLLFGFKSYSQDLNRIDSLKNLLSETENIEKVNILNELAFYYHTIDYDKGIDYAKKAISLSKKIKIDTLIVDSYNALITNFWAKSELDSAMYYSKKALKIAYYLNDSISISQTYYNFALIVASDSKYNLAIKYYDTAYNYVKHNQIRGKIGIEINKGVSYYNLTNYKQALKYFLKAAKFYENNNSEINLPYTYNLLGNIYIDTGEEKKGLKYFKEALKISKKYNLQVEEGTSLQSIAAYFEKIKKPDSSIIYLKKALVLAKKTGRKIMTVDIYASLGDNYLEIQKIDSAKYYYNIVINLAKKNNDEWAKTSGFIGIANVLLKQKEFKRAIYYYEKAQFIAIKIDSKEILKDIYENLSKAYIGEKKYKKATIIQNKYIKLTDSLYNEETTKQLSNMKVSYETEKKENENAKLKIEKKLNEKTIENQKTINIAIIIVIILSSLLIIALFLNRRKIKNANNRLLVKNQQIQQQKEEILIQTENLESAYTHLKELQNFKNGLIGMIVHDLKNPLNIIINMSENEFVADSGNKMLNMVNNILDVEKYEEVGMPINPENLNLKDLFKKSVSKNNFLALLQKIKIENNIDKNIIIKADKEIIERVIDNLLTNAIKFSPANGRILLNSKTDNDFVHISVSDEGVGISEEFQEKIFDKFVQVEAKKSGFIRSTGLGLTFCKLAVEAHNGTISLKSAKNKGTTFTFTIPNHNNI